MRVVPMLHATSHTVPYTLLHRTRLRNLNVDFSMIMEATSSHRRWRRRATIRNPRRTTRHALHAGRLEDKFHESGE